MQLGRYCQHQHPGWATGHTNDPHWGREEKCGNIITIQVLENRNRKSSIKCSLNINLIWGIWMNLPFVGQSLSLEWEWICFYKPISFSKIQMKIWMANLKCMYIFTFLLISICNENCVSPAKLKPSSSNKSLCSVSYYVAVFKTGSLPVMHHIQASSDDFVARTNYYFF